MGDGYGPMLVAKQKFNREELPWQERKWRRADAGITENEDYAAFYVDLYQSVRHGAPLVVTPQSVRRTLSVLEKCRAQVPNA